jgi:hypothetical protein
MSLIPIYRDLSTVNRPRLCRDGNIASGCAGVLLTEVPSSSLPVWKLQLFFVLRNWNGRAHKISRRLEYVVVPFSVSSPASMSCTYSCTVPASKQGVGARSCIVFQGGATYARYQIQREEIDTHRYSRWQDSSPQSTMQRLRSNAIEHGLCMRCIRRRRHVEEVSTLSKKDLAVLL